MSLQYINLAVRSTKCWICLKLMTGVVNGAYRYHAECFIARMNSAEDKRAEKRKTR